MKRPVIAVLKISGFSGRVTSKMGSIFQRLYIFLQDILKIIGAYRSRAYFPCNLSIAVSVPVASISTMRAQCSLTMRPPPICSFLVLFLSPRKRVSEVYRFQRAQS